MSTRGSWCGLIFPQIINVETVLAAQENQHLKSLDNYYVTCTCIILLIVCPYLKMLLAAIDPPLRVPILLGEFYKSVPSHQFMFEKWIKYGKEL